MKKTVYKDTEKSLLISSEENVVYLHFKNIYGECIIREYKLIDDWDDTELFEDVEDRLIMWGFWGVEDRLYEIIDKIEDFVYSIPIN